MFIGWLTCIPAVLLPHSPFRFAKVNTPANRQMPIASVVMRQCIKKEDKCFSVDKLQITNKLIYGYQPKKRKGRKRFA